MATCYHYPIILPTIIAYRHTPVTADDVERFLRAPNIEETDTAALQTFFVECPLPAQLAFLRDGNIPLEVALSALDRFVKPMFRDGFPFPLEVWR